MRRILAVAVFMVLACGAVSAAVKPNSLFTDGAVLQRGIRVPVWGTANDGERVTVKFRDQVVSTVAKDGKWRVNLTPLSAGGPYDMTISGDNTIKLTNILVGDVWICSGQSNMQFALTYDSNAAKVIPTATDKKLRLFTVPPAPSATPIDDVNSSWKLCSPDTVKDFAAVAYYFGLNLRQELGVPIGLINTSLGGTPAEAWTRLSAIMSNPDFRGLVDRRLSTTEWAALKPGYLYSSMIYPLQPYAIKGAIWYQGESNAGRAYQYRTLFPAMVRSWREDWMQGDFPFLFVQIAPFMLKSSTPQESAWAELREAQLLSANSIKNSAMAVITDLGDENDIHPRQKGPVGYRLSLAARALAYGENVVYSGPTYKSMQVKDGRAIIEFDNAEGLAAKGGPLTGFAIAGSDRRFVNAKAEIVGGKVVVSSPEVANPVAVRMGWANYPEVNLYNKAGLPASPFRTDDFPMVTGPK